MKDSYTAEEEQVFERLHLAFQELAEEFGGKTIFEITDIFMKVSGDLEALKAYLNNEKNNRSEISQVAEWNYIEDMALSMPENSTEYRDLLIRKGRLEIEKRKFFLLGAQGYGLHTAQQQANSSMVTHPQQSQM